MTDNYNDAISTLVCAKQKSPWKRFGDEIFQMSGLRLERWGKIKHAQAGRPARVIGSGWVGIEKYSDFPVAVTVESNQDDQAESGESPAGRFRGGGQPACGDIVKTGGAVGAIEIPSGREWFEQAFERP